MFRLLQQYQYMLEVMNDHQDFSESTSEHRQRPEAKEFKLPKIERLPSRGFPKEIKSSTKLPTLRSQTHVQYSDANSQRKATEDDDFVGQVEKKLRLIMQQQNIMELQESEQSDGDNFEKKINQNKEIIKQAKRKNEKMKKQNQQLNFYNKMSNIAGKKFSQKIKIDAYQKRQRQHKEGSLQSKHLNKKKQILCNLNKNALAAREIKESLKEIPKSSLTLKESNPNNRQIKDVKSKDQLIPIHKVLPNLHIPKNHHPSAEPKKMKKQYSQKNLTPVQNNQQLFDAIHNYLQNPKRTEVEINPQKIVKQRVELQQKLREYEQKLNPLEAQLRNKQNFKSESIDLQKQQNINMVTSTQWRKIGVSQNNIANETSSFDKQIDRIGVYLQRNEKSLQKYVQNQKMLLDVQMARRQSSKQRYVPSDKQSSL